MATESQDKPERQRDELAKVLFDERMVMVRHLVGKADRAEAEYFFRTLVEQVKFLSRKHGLELRK
jgi:hypothetical protein